MNITLDQLTRAQHDPAKRPALAIDMLGGRVGDEVRAQLQRLLVERRRKHVVDDQLGAMRLGDLGYARDVDELDGRIGRRLDEHHLGVRRMARSKFARSRPSTSVEGTPKRGIRSSTT